MKLLFPDACWRPDLISGATFLYFRTNPLVFTLHPSVSTFLTGIDPHSFFQYVDERQPRWVPKFSAFIRTQAIYRTSLHGTSDILEPLRGTGFKTLWYSYPRGEHAWESAEDLISSSGLSFDEITGVIDAFSAADELYSHIFFEKYLELYEGNRSIEEMVAFASDLAKSQLKPGDVSVDWKALYEYCDARFGGAELNQLLTVTYMFRLPVLKSTSAILLTNPNLISLLASLPIDAKPRQGEMTPVDLDVIAWEFFRQLVSKRIDPIAPKQIQAIQKLILQHPAEVDALKNRCYSLAQELSSERDLEVLQKRIAQHIRAKVESEIQALLFLDKAAINEFLDLVFSDQKSWISIATFLYSLTQGQAVLTAGSAIFALSSLGSKGVKALSERRKKLEVSDYALLYRMRPEA
jgi:hypothetical protein